MGCPGGATWLNYCNLVLIRLAPIAMVRSMMRVTYAGKDRVVVAAIETDDAETVGVVVDSSNTGGVVLAGDREIDGLTYDAGGGIVFFAAKVICGVREASTTDAIKVLFGVKMPCAS